MFYQSSIKQVFHVLTFYIISMNFFTFNYDIWLTFQMSGLTTSSLPDNSAQLSFNSILPLPKGCPGALTPSGFHGVGCQGNPPALGTSGHRDCDNHASIHQFPTPLPGVDRGGNNILEKVRTNRHWLNTDPWLSYHGPTTAEYKKPLRPS